MQHAILSEMKILTCFFFLKVFKFFSFNLYSEKGSTCLALLNHILYCVSLKSELKLLAYIEYLRIWKHLKSIYILHLKMNSNIYSIYFGSLVLLWYKANYLLTSDAMVSAKCPTGCQKHTKDLKLIPKFQAFKREAYFSSFLSLCVGNKVTVVHMHNWCTDIIHSIILLSLSQFAIYYKGSALHIHYLCYLLCCRNVLDLILIILYKARSWLP